MPSPTTSPISKELSEEEESHWETTSNESTEEADFVHESLRPRAIHYPPYIVSDKVDHPLRKPPFLCRFCTVVVEQCSVMYKTQHYKQLDHHTDIASFRQSVRDGCGFCAQLENGRSNSFRPLVGSRRPQNGGIGWSGGIVYLEVPRKSGQLSGSVFRFKVHILPSERPAIFSDSISAPSTLDALPLCKAWVQNCLETHEQCNSVHGKPQTPSRLIAINGTVLRLCEMKHLVDSFRYATLSHCWGGKEFLRLRMNNLASFLVEILPGKLPKTFQDAIFIARYLGFDYIWIDSLCITQDDNDDWVRESATMKDVYEGSTLNIAAVSAEDGSTGCFFRRNPAWRCQVRSKRDGLEELYDVLPRFWTNPERCPLFTRGWVLQERYLSRRTLYFHEQQVFWDCLEHSKSETRALPSASSFMDWTNQFHCGKVTRDTWWTIVRRYSEMSLTKNSDILVAIGGLAEYIQAQTGDEYIAGLWKTDLPSQLLYFTYASSKEPTSRGYIAPSWSWASLDFPNPLYFEDVGHWDSYQCYAKVADVTVITTSPSAFGQIKSATLRLVCEHLWYSRIEFPANDYQATLLFEIKRHEFRAYPDRKWKHARSRLGNIMDDPGRESIPKGTQANTIEEQLLEDDNVSNAAKSLPHVDHYLLLPLGCSRWDCLQGLLLESTEAKRGQYRRVGVFKFYGDFQVQDYNPAEAKPKASYCAEIMSDDMGVEKYVIEII